MMKSKIQILKMVSELTQYKKVAENQRDVIVCNAQIDVLNGTKKISDFDKEKADVRKAVKAANDWLAGNVTDEALFI